MLLIDTLKEQKEMLVAVAAFMFIVYIFADSADKLINHYKAKEQAHGMG